MSPLPQFHSVYGSVFKQILFLFYFQLKLALNVRHFFSWSTSFCLYCGILLHVLFLFSSVFIVSLSQFASLHCHGRLSTFALSTSFHVCIDLLFLLFILHYLTPFISPPTHSLSLSPHSQSLPLHSSSHHLFPYLI